MILHTLENDDSVAANAADFGQVMSKDARRQAPESWRQSVAARKLERLLDFADTDGTLVRDYVFFDKQLSEKCDLPEPRPPYAPL